MDFINLVALSAEEILFNSSSDEEGEEKKQFIKITNYAEYTVWNYTERQFFIHFRMTPRTFQSLLKRLIDISPQPLRGGSRETSLEKQLLMTIWYLANLESFRSVADRFDLSSYTPWTCFYKICRRLLQLNRRDGIIAWPNEQKCEITSEAFERRYGFPGIIGAIDGSHIPIKSPTTNSASYINRKGFHSILLQAVCDHNYKFIDCYVGEVGSIHDACMFRRSHLGRNFTNMQFLDNGHLLGDLAYPLLKNLLVPFKDNGHLNQIQINYNNIHSKCRVVIEQAFALLKGRFRRLKFLEITRIKLITLVVISACLLHNSCRTYDDNEALANIEAEVEEERVMNFHHQEPLEYENVNEAIVKRNEIANALYHIPL